MHLRAVIDEFVLYIEIEKNYSVNTATSYEYDLQLFLTFLTDHGCSTCLNEITKTQVRRFIQYLLGSLNLKPRSVNRKISSLKSFTKYCLKEQYLANDFTHGIESPETADKLPVYIRLTDLKQLFAFLERDQSRFALMINRCGIPIN
ncbi:site-specific integrase [Viridibacillus sp. NPDC096237]|uniref:site-specific integrase n=1 Tax=Viridibacillus sp. NPDC096237 TaxID=3390721 RepID=UPI003D0480AF